MPFKNLPDAANKLWESVYNSSKDNGDSEEIAAKKAWATVSRAYKKVGDKWVKKSDIVPEFSMAIVNAPYDKVTGEMRWKAVASDASPDLYGERMDLGLYESFITNIEEEQQPPESFRSLVTSDYWKGGMPYVSVSHYPDLNGDAVPGTTKALYIDGERFKAKGVFFDNDLGRVCHRALNKDIQEKLPQDKRIRVSIAFLDLAHRHGDGVIFERNSLDDFCPECAAGVGGKVYLKGYLVHLALTRSPVNPRTEVEVERAMTTRKEDAASIIGDEEAEKLEEKAALVGKSEALIVKAEDDEVDGEVSEATEQAEEFVEREAGLTAEEESVEVVVAESATEKDKAAQKARSKKYGIAILAQGAVTKPSKWESVPDSQWGDPVNYRYPMPDEAHARNAAARFAQENGSYRGRKVVGERIAKREKALGVGKEKADTIDVPRSDAVAVLELPYGGAISLADAMAAQEAQEEMWRISSVWAIFRDVVWNILDRADVEDKKGALSAAVDEFKGALTAKSMLMEQPDSLFTKIRSLYDNVVAARALTADEQSKRQAVQPALDEVGAAIVAELKPAASQAEEPKELDINKVKSLIAESLAPISDQLAVIAARLARPSEPKAVPVPRSMSPQAMRSLFQTQEAKLSPIDKLARRSVGLPD